MAAVQFLPKIVERECLGCGNCIAACPLSNPSSPAFQKGEPKIKLESGIAKIIDRSDCRKRSDIPDDCEECTLFCPTDAIEITET